MTPSKRTIERCIWCDAFHTGCDIAVDWFQFFSYGTRVFCGLTWPWRKCCGAFTAGLEAEDESQSFTASYSQRGFPPALPLSFPSISSFERLCNVLSSYFNHRFLSFSAGKHKRRKVHVLWSLCEAQQHSELWGCHIVLDGT